MLIINQTPLQFVLEYIELIKVDSQKLGQLFDYGLYVVTARKTLYRSHLELLV